MGLHRVTCVCIRIKSGGTGDTHDTGRRFFVGGRAEPCGLGTWPVTMREVFFGP